MSWTSTSSRKRTSGGNRIQENQVAILGAALWGVTAGELSKIGIGDVLDARGQLRSSFHLRAAISYNDFEREIPLDPRESKRFTGVLEQYINWKLARGIGVVKSARFRGLDPESVLLVKDNGAPFAFTRRSKKSTEGDQPSGMNRLFRQMLQRTKFAGVVTYKDFRRSFIIHMARPEEGGLKMKNLMAVSGIRDYESAKKIVDLDPRRVSEQVVGIYKRLQEGADGEQQ